MRTPVVLHAISSFDDATLNRTATPVIAGLSESMAADPLRNEIANSPDFWSILQRLHRHPDQAEKVFEILQTTIEAEQHIIGADNYESAISLANDFATAAQLGMGQDEKGDAGPRRTRPPPKQAKQPYVQPPFPDHKALYRLTSTATTSSSSAAAKPSPSSTNSRTASPPSSPNRTSTPMKPGPPTGPPSSAP